MLFANYYLSNSGGKPQKKKKRAAAAQKGRFEVVAQLLATPEIDPNQALCVAVLTDKAGVVAQLLATPEIDPNQANRCHSPVCRRPDRHSRMREDFIAQATAHWNVFGNA